MSSTTGVFSTGTKVIPVSIDRLWDNYLDRPLQGAFKAHMDGLERARQAYIKANPTKDQPPENTPCVIQISRALNFSGIHLPAHSFWRPNPLIEGYWYLQAVNELQVYLGQRFFQGTTLPTLPDARKKALAGKSGILTFGGFHTELWRIDRIRQRDNIPLPDGTVVAGMSGKIWEAKTMQFWEVGGSGDFEAPKPVPDEILGWWKVWDGNTYYYYFESDGVVFYTTTAPKSVKATPDNRDRKNYGKVEPIIGAPFQLRITWLEVGTTATVETFTDTSSGALSTMRGKSNLYGDLVATKMR